MLCTCKSVHGVSFLKSKFRCESNNEKKPEKQRTDYERQSSVVSLLRIKISHEYFIRIVPQTCFVSMFWMSYC